MNRVDVYRSLKSPVAPFVRRRWNRQPFVGAARLAKRYLRIWENTSHDLAANGEADMLRRLSDHGLRVVVDVGCHVGAWTDQALVHLPGAAVHAFEADPYLADALESKYRSEPRVSLNKAGLADVTGEATLFVNEDARNVSSMVRQPDVEFAGVTVPVLRGDEYARTAGFDEIDFLKIDTEGFDWNIVVGFDSMLGARIKVIQFEYNLWNLLSRHLLADFYELLGAKGYVMGKLHLNGVDFKAYDMLEENWIGPACIAVHESAPELVTTLSMR